MAKFFVTILCLCFLATTADAQSFYKKRNRFKRSYIAKAITAPVHRPAVRFANVDQATFGTPEEGVEEYRDKSPRSIRRAQRLAERRARREARAIARAERKKDKTEDRALGQALVAHNAYHVIKWR